MIRILLALFLALGRMAWLMPGTCVAQTTDPNTQSPNVKQQAPAATGAENPNAMPVDPQVAVPEAKNGEDPYGRPVQPVGATEAPVPPPVAATEQQERIVLERGTMSALGAVVGGSGADTCVCG